jgi:RNA polymerase sporulation-specific sigma factor
MNHSEIEACIIHAKDGQKEELNKILQQYKPFIIKTARQFNIKSHDTNDLLQIGYLALINAVEKYRTGSNSFSSYAYSSIKNALRYTIRQNIKYETEFSLNAPIVKDGSTNTEFIDFIESQECFEDDIIKAEEITEVNQVISRLPKDELELVHALYYDKCPLRTYAEKIGISYFQATRKKNWILTKLKFICL